MNYELNRTWVVQPSLNFVSIGAREEVEYVGKVNMNELYIQLPIMMAARLNLGKNYSASLSAGPYIAYGVGGKTSGEMEEYDYSSEYNPNRSYRFRIDTFGNRIDDKMGKQTLRRRPYVRPQHRISQIHIRSRASIRNDQGKRPAG